jgi:hypothetical protein
MYRGSVYSAGGAVGFHARRWLFGPWGLGLQEPSQLGDGLRGGDLELVQAVELHVDPVHGRVRGCPFRVLPERLELAHLLRVALHRARLHLMVGAHDEQQYRPVEPARLPELEFGQGQPLGVVLR